MIHYGNRMTLAGPAVSASPAGLRDEMVMLTSNISTLIAERGLKEPRQVLGLVNRSNYPQLAAQTNLDKLIEDVAAAVFVAGKRSPQVAKLLQGAKTTGGPAAAQSLLRTEFERMVAEMSEIARDLGKQSVGELAAFINMQRSYPALAQVVRNPRAMVFDVAQVLLTGGPLAQLDSIFQRYTGETVSGWTVGFDLSDAKFIADVTTSLLPAVTKDPKVLQIANLAKAGLGVATGVEAGSISNAIKAGAQAAQGTASLLGIESDALQKALAMVQQTAAMASPYEKAQRVADQFRSELQKQGIPAAQVEQAVQRAYQTTLQDAMQGPQQGAPQPAPQPTPQPGMPGVPSGNFGLPVLPGGAPFSPQPVTPQPQPVAPVPGANVPTQVAPPPTNTPTPAQQGPWSRLGLVNIPDHGAVRNAVPECDPRAAGPCRQQYNRMGTIESRGTNQTCCRARPTGRGVLVAEHAGDSDLWPGGYWEAPAGDYYYISCRQAEELTPEYGQVDMPNVRKPGVACMRTGGKKISSLVVPEDWSVVLYSRPNFRGESTELFEGEHNLDAMGWGDRVFSMKIRGPWSVADGMVYEALSRRAKGWATEATRKKPEPRDIVQAILLDPQRVEPSTYNDEPVATYTSSYGPGWKKLLEDAKESNSGVGRALRMGFQRLGLLD